MSLFFYCFFPVGACSTPTAPYVATPLPTAHPFSPIIGMVSEPEGLGLGFPTLTFLTIAGPQLSMVLSYFKYDKIVARIQASTST